MNIIFLLQLGVFLLHDKKNLFDACGNLHLMYFRQIVGWFKIGLVCQSFLDPHLGLVGHNILTRETYGYYNPF